MTASSVPPAPAFDARQHLAGLLRAALASVAPSHGAVDIVLERPKQASHGDFASNLAMQLARELKTNPRQVAERLVRELPPSPHVVRAEVAGAGFINFTLAPAARTAVVRRRARRRRRLRARPGPQRPDGAPPAGRIRFRQSHRPAACRPRPRRRLRRQPGVAAGLRRLRGDARVLRQRCRPPDGHPRRVDLAALPGAVRRAAALPAQRLPGRLRARDGGTDQAGPRRPLRASGRSRAGLRARH
jgi:hypothetical protein